ncbi:hypothetical protein GY45DRAFT_1319817 [Cubamyces sp. BRFM 1775]|nr:hypothetical protein GY45DRAFT_1319817 [Cubamyces sp. BRFM 1775]
MMLAASWSLRSILLPVALYVFGSAVHANAAASLTPPVDTSSSTSASVGLSLSFTPVSSATATGSAQSGVSGSGTATATSSAPFPSLTGLSDCATQCFGLAISQDGCGSIVDVNCYCHGQNATRFANALVACISEQCPGDLPSAESISEQFCALASTSTSISFPTSVPSTSFSDPFTSSTSAPASGNGSSTTAPPSSGTSSGGQSSSTATATSTTNAARGLVAVDRGVGAAALLGLVAAFAGFALL